MKKEWKTPSLEVLDVNMTMKKGNGAGPPNDCGWEPGDGQPPWAGGPGGPGSSDCIGLS